MATNNQLNTGSTPISVVEGGTGVATMTTAYAPVCAGTTATGLLQVASTGLSTSGFALTSNGSSALPSFQALPVAINKTSITLTTANIRSMFASPIQVVAAQGANTMIVVYNTVFEYIFSGSAFSGGAGDGLGPYLVVGSPSAGIYNISNLEITALSASAIFYGGPYDAIGISYSILFSASTVNKGLFMTNATAPYTGGGGSMKVTVYYTVLSTTL